MSIVSGYDSFVSLCEADTYWDKYGGGCNWEGATDKDKERALRSAAEYLSNLNWSGVECDCNQPLAFPRNYNVASTNYHIDSCGGCGCGDCVCGTSKCIIPEPIKKAQIKLALDILCGRFDPNSNVATNAIKSLKTGNLSIEFKDDANVRQIGNACEGELVNANPLEYLMPLILPYLNKPRKFGSVKMCRG